MAAIPFEPRIDVSYFHRRTSGRQRIAILDEIIGRMQDMLRAE
ncbi:hypothetical protein J2767_004475 [Agrobacterium tumefaciens]|nr:hypothetical protein [Agrobacterium tumefaciens]MBP2573282.1 hypothetical protein [Agrobacterium tumefaciens]